MKPKPKRNGVQLNVYVHRGVRRCLQDEARRHGTSLRAITTFALSQGIAVLNNRVAGDLS